MSRTEQLIAIVRNDMKPAMGVTEPAAIAYAAALAAEHSRGSLRSLQVTVNPGIYKNAFTCGIPNTREVGTQAAAAIGYLLRDSSRGLLFFEGMQESTAEQASALVESGCVSVKVDESRQTLYICVEAETETDRTSVTLTKSHTHIERIERNGEVLYAESADHAEENPEGEPQTGAIRTFTLSDFLCAAEEAPLQDLSFMKEAYRLNLALAEAAVSSDRCPMTARMQRDRQEGKEEQGFAGLATFLTNAAAEARVLGLSLPAMSITGSGNHGILATLPLYAFVKASGLSEEKLLRATLISYLVTEYIKEYSGKLSAFCGCGIAAGTGMACALTWLKGGCLQQMERTLSNMASAITGMICTGGNHACCLKVLAALDCAIRSSDFAMEGVAVDWKNGILGKTPEETMRYMGRIASPGMVETDLEILNILKEKAAGEIQ